MPTFCRKRQVSSFYSVLKQPCTKLCHRQTYYWNNLPGTSVLSFAIFLQYILSICIIYTQLNEYILLSQRSSVRLLRSPVEATAHYVSFRSTLCRNRRWKPIQLKRGFLISSRQRLLQPVVREVYCGFYEPKCM